MQFSTKSLYALILISNIVFIALLLNSFHDYQAANESLNSSKEAQTRTVNLALELRKTSDDLTRMVRSYVETSNPIFKQQFEKVLDIRNGRAPRPTNYLNHFWSYGLEEISTSIKMGETISLKELMKSAGLTSLEFEQLEQAEAISNKLAKIENAAMEKVIPRVKNSKNSGFKVKEISKLFSDEYHKHKTAIMKPINTFFQLIQTRTSKQIEISRRASDEAMNALILFTTLFGLNVLAGIFAIHYRFLRPLSVQRKALISLSGGDLSTDIPMTNRDDEIGDIARAGVIFRNTLQDITHQNRIHSCSSAVLEAMQSADTIEKASEQFLSILLNALQGGYGILYTYSAESEHLSYKAGYGLDLSHGLNATLQLGQTILGQAALKKSPILMNTPDDYIKITSSIGGARPEFIAAYPFLIDNRLIGAFEIASFSDLNEQDEELITRLLPIVSLNINDKLINFEVQAKEKRTREILANAVVGIITISESGLIESMNNAAEKIFGYSESSIKGENVKILMPEPDKSQHDGYLDNHIKTGEKKIIGIGRRVTGIRRDGTEFPMHLGVSPVVLDGVKTFTGTITDLSGN